MEARMRRMEPARASLGGRHMSHHHMTGKHPEMQETEKKYGWRWVGRAGVLGPIQIQKKLSCFSRLALA